MQVLVDEFEKLAGRWIVLAILEADLSASMHDDKYEMNGHLVRRCMIDGGRAVKIVVNKFWRDFETHFCAGRRVFQIEFQTTSDRNTSCLNFVFGHFAHGDAWYDSFEEWATQVESTTAKGDAFFLADFNVEARCGHRSRDHEEKWHTLESFLANRDLCSLQTLDVDTITR